MTIKHETLTFNRILEHAPARVFRAFTQTAELEKWSPPDESMNMRIEKGSCDPGSRLIWGCGPGEAEGIRIQSDYFHIEQDTALLYSEALYMQDTLLSVIQGLDLTLTTGALEQRVIQGSYLPSLASAVSVYQPNHWHWWGSIGIVRAFEI